MIIRVIPMRLSVFTLIVFILGALSVPLRAEDLTQSIEYQADIKACQTRMRFNAKENISKGLSNQKATHQFKQCIEEAKNNHADED